MIAFVQLTLILVVLCVAQGSTATAEKPKPFFWEKAETARWLAHQNLWGTLSTTSVHLNGQAWGQPKSFVDGSSSNSTGDLYFYDSDMDTSMEDANANPLVAFSLSLAQSVGYCNVQRLDPEDPRCARVVFSGRFQQVTDPEELKFAQSSLFERHPQMEGWPEDHSWKIHKIVISEIWLIDIYGGASIIDPKDYYAVDVESMASKFSAVKL
mmetsp:Transcript_21845/g.36556  ORF Transcript_21845/g.36556 Transcript_21845/m.36556 type:complete len:211 (-) Transcript_21845:238-870(-)